VDQGSSGATSTVNALALVAVPTGVVTLIGPVVAPVGTVASIEVAEVTVEFALTPLKVTAVAPVKFVPLIVTLVMTGGPFVGVKLVIVGGGTVTVANAIVQIPDPELVSHQKSTSPSPFASPTRQLLGIGVLGAGPLTFGDVTQPLPVEIAMSHMPEPELVSHHMSIIPSRLRSPVKHWFLTGMPGAGPLTVDVVQPLPVESATDHVPEPELVSHHMSAILSPLRSPVKQ